MYKRTKAVVELLQEEESLVLRLCPLEGLFSDTEVRWVPNQEVRMGARVTGERG